jgi:hypothetical protein
MPTVIHKRYIHEEFETVHLALVWVNKNCADGRYRLHTMWQFNTIHAILEYVPNA